MKGARLTKKGEPRFARETGPFLAVSKPSPELRSKPAAGLLDLTRGLPGNLRYAFPGRPEAEVMLVGEVPLEEGAASVEEARRRLERLLKAERGSRGSPPEKEKKDLEAQGECVECVLEALGFEWSRRNGLWVVPPADGRRQELQVSLEAEGARVATVLTESETRATDERGRKRERKGEGNGEGDLEALALFFLRAHDGLRFVRCELEGSRAGVVSLAASDHLECDLPHSLNAVIAASRLLAREATALEREEVAQLYREHCACSR